MVDSSTMLLWEGQVLLDWDIVPQASSYVVLEWRHDSWQTLTMVSAPPLLMDLSPGQHQITIQSQRSGHVVSTLADPVTIFV